jgi:hypothetical protein
MANSDMYKSMKLVNTKAVYRVYISTGRHLILIKKIIIP